MLIKLLNVVTLLWAMHFIIVIIVINLSMSILLVKVVFVILVGRNIFRIVLIQFLLNLLIANIATLFLLFHKNSEFSFAEIETSWIYFLKLVLIRFYLGFLNSINLKISSLGSFLLCILLVVILNGILIYICF